MDEVFSEECPALPDLDVPAAKARLRAVLRAHRRTLTAEERHHQSIQACHQLAASPEFTHAQTIGLYWPMPDELDPNQLLDLAAAQAKTFAWPRTSEADRRLTFHTVADGPETPPGSPGARNSIAATLTPGPYGILEPTGERIAPQRLDLLIMPGLGFDRRGQRLGYGGGYYDRFLARHGVRPVTVGIGFDGQFLADKLPTDIHDQPVHLVITPSALVRFDRPGEVMR